MRKMFKLGDKAVSQVIGYLLTFAIISATTVTVVYTTSVLLERRATAAAEIIAQDVANHVVDVITECIAMKQEFPNANYSRVINVPTTINGKNYYIVATDERVYVNTTDGKVSAKSTTYKQSELCIGISGKVYPSSGKIKVYVNKSDYLYRIDFGTDTSPGEYGYTRFSQSSLYRNAWWDLNWSYRANIFVDNPNKEDLQDFQIRIILDPQSFDYGNVNQDGSDIRFTNSTGGVLPYWIEKWDYYGVSYIWFKADLLVGDSRNVFYLYYGNPNATVSQSDGNAVFEFFDDFDSFDSSVWELYPQDSKDISVENGHLEISNGTLIVTKHATLADGIIETKAMAVSTGGDTEASILARCQKRTPNPLNSTYHFSSGSFSVDQWKNFSIGKDFTIIFNYKKNPMEPDIWYLLRFLLHGGNLGAVRYNYYVPTLYENMNVTDFSYRDGNFGLYTTNGCRARYDWILCHKIANSTPIITVGAPASKHYTWVDENLNFVDYPLIQNSLIRDETASNSTNYIMFEVQPSQIYSVTVKIGDPSLPLNNVYVWIEDRLVLVNISTEKGSFFTDWFIVDNISDDGILDIKFACLSSSPSDFWSLASIVVEKGIKGVKIRGV